VPVEIPAVADFDEPGSTTGASVHVARDSYGVAITVLPGCAR
jgi:hypothetical protein